MKENTDNHAKNTPNRPGGVKNTRIKKIIFLTDPKSEDRERFKLLMTNVIRITREARNL